MHMLKCAYISCNLKRYYSIIKSLYCNIVFFDNVICITIQILNC